MLKIALLFTIISLGVISCDTNSSSNMRERYGRISRSCGPTDGPEIEIILSDSLLSCGNIFSIGYKGSFKIDSLSLIKIDWKTIYNSEKALQLCDTNLICGNLGPMTVVFTDTLNGEYFGKYEIKNGKEVIENGHFKLNVCKDQIGLCGWRQLMNIQYHPEKQQLTAVYSRVLGAITTP